MVTRRSIAHAGALACTVTIAACGGTRAQDADAASSPGAVAGAAADVIMENDVRRMLTLLSHDSMEGRRTGTPGARRAALAIASEMRALGLEPAGDDGYLQTVPLSRVERNGRPGLQVLIEAGVRDTAAADGRVDDWNVVGVIRGSDPAVRDEAIVVGAHHDHVGIGRPVNGDSIYNGADDDASGVVAVLQIAKAIAAGPAPRRTVVFVTFTGEEMGLLGTRYYLAYPTVPLEQTVAQLQIEMIGRPDSLAGGPGRAWLTGYERSTMGDLLAANGVPIVADPRPEQNFFERSDNIAFARLGIPAHTLSSFGLHTDYHRPSDDVDKVDFPHMTEVTRAAAHAVLLLADGEVPRWHPGGRPEPR